MTTLLFSPLTVSTGLLSWHIVPLHATFWPITNWLLPSGTMWRMKTVFPRLDRRGRAIDPRICLCGEACSPVPYCQKTHPDGDSGIRPRASFQLGSSSQLTVANSSAPIAEYGAPLSIKGPGTHRLFNLVQLLIRVAVSCRAPLLNLMGLAGLFSWRWLSLSICVPFVSILLVTAVGLDVMSLRRLPSSLWSPN